MEIKVGDKVRMSKDTPKLLFTRSICNYPEYVFEVRVIEDDLADIYYGAGKIPLAAFVVPTKYLIKVEDEAKESKFKKGDKVRFKKIYTVVSVDDGQVFIDSAGNHFDEDCLELYTEPTAPTIKVGDRVCCYNILHIKGSKKEDYMGYVASITDMGITIQLDKGGLVLVYHESDLELVQPKEQTEAEKTDTDNIVDDFAKVMEGYRKVFADITDNFDWLRYEADLAKEIALKVANKYSDPKEAAGYAVSVAKAVVENLKKK